MLDQLLGLVMKNHAYNIVSFRLVRFASRSTDTSRVNQVVDDISPDVPRDGNGLLNAVAVSMICHNGVEAVVSSLPLKPSASEATLIEIGFATYIVSSDLTLFQNHAWVSFLQRFRQACVVTLSETPVEPLLEDGVELPTAIIDCMHSFFGLNVEVVRPDQGLSVRPNHVFISKSEGHYTPRVSSLDMRRVKKWAEAVMDFRGAKSYAITQKLSKANMEQLQSSSLWQGSLRVQLQKRLTEVQQTCSVDQDGFYNLPLSFDYAPVGGLQRRVYKGHDMRMPSWRNVCNIQTRAHNRIVSNHARRRP